MVFLPTLSPKPSQLSVWAAQPFPIQSPRCNINTRQQRHGSPRWTEGFLSLSSLDNIFSFHVVRLAVQLGQSDGRMVLMQLLGQLPDSARAAHSPPVPEEEVFPPFTALLPCTTLQSMKSNAVPKLATPEVQSGRVLGMWFKQDLRQLKWGPSTWEEACVHKYICLLPP